MKPSESAGSVSYRPRELRPSPAGDDRVNLLRAGWRQRWMIVLSITLGIAGAIVYLQRATPTYASVGRLYVQRSIPRIATDPLNNLPESSNYLYTQSEIIKSTGVINEVAKLAQVLRLPTLAGARSVAAEIQEHLKADVDGRNDLISVTFESSDPTDASVVVNAIIDQYISFTTRQHHNSAAEVLRILEKDKAARDEQLTAQLERMKQFKQANPALSFTSADRRGNLAVETLSRLTDALTVARLATIDARSAYEAAVQRAKLSLPAGSVVADPLLRDELIRLEERRETLRSVLGENSRDVQSVDASIARLQDRMAAQDKAGSDAAVASAQQAWDAVAAKQKEIEGQVQAQEKLAIAVNSAEAEYASLDAELQRNQKISDIIDARIKELNVTEDAPPTTVTILEAARPSVRPIAPDKSRVVAGGMLLGVLLGITLAWLRDALQQRVGLSAEEIESALGVTVLGSIPHAAASDLAKCGRAVELESQSAMAEAYRSVRTMIVFGIAGDFKTLLVTSPCPGDGKTTAAANLAIAIAQSGQRTLLIDADLRRPSASKIFNTASRVGVAEVVAGRTKLREAIQATGIDGLSILYAGTPPPNPSEILSGLRFGQLLAAVTPVYDKIVIDSPPLGSVSDGQILAASADATVLVIRAGRSSRKASQSAATSLASVNARVVGVILNDQPRRGNASSYYSAYSDVPTRDDSRQPATNGTQEIPSIAREGGSSY